MAVQIVETGITVSVPTLEDGIKVGKHRYTKSSDFLSWSDGVDYAFIRGKVLQSADTAGGFMHDYNGDDYSSEYQLTRTLTGYAPEGAVVRAYVAELPSDKLKVFAEWMRGRNYLEVSLNNEFVQLLRRLGAKRTFVVPDEDLELSVLVQNGKNAYASSRVVRCYLPRNAEKHAAHMRKSGYNSGRVWFDHAKIGKGKMRIRPVGVVGDGIGSVYADYIFINYDGRVRGE